MTDVELRAVYLGESAALALYRGKTLRWSGFEMPEQNGSVLRITQVYRAESGGSKLEVE